MSLDIKLGLRGNERLKFLGNRLEIEDSFVGSLNDCLQTSYLDPSVSVEDRNILHQISEHIRGETHQAANIGQYQGHFSLSPQEVTWMKRHDVNLWSKYLVHRFKFKTYPAQKKLLNFPLHLLIEPTAVCNLRCVMCFQTDSVFDTQAMRGSMPWELFQSIVDQAVHHNCHAVTLASRGEPTIHPQLGKMLHYLSENKVMEVKLNTNATLLKEKTCHEILSAGVSIVVFSVDAGTKETYERIRIGGNFDKIVANIQMFSRIRDAHYPNSPTLTRLAGVKVYPEQNIEQIHQFWSEYVDQVTITPAAAQWDTYNNPTLTIDEPCMFLWESLYVWYNGIVNPCDVDYKSYLAVGNANESTLTSLWLGDKYTRLRNEHSTKQRSKCIPCDRCPKTW